MDMISNSAGVELDSNELFQESKLECMHQSHDGAPSARKKNQMQFGAWIMPILNRDNTKATPPR